MRFPPASPLREARTCPNVPRPVFPSTSVRLLRGSSKFGWLGRLVKLDSNFNLNLSVSRKPWASPRERLIVPGPPSDPTPALPKRPTTPPLGRLAQSSVLLDKPVPGAKPGQEYTLGFQYCVRVW